MSGAPAAEAFAWLRSGWQMCQALQALRRSEMYLYLTQLDDETVLEFVVRPLFLPSSMAAEYTAGGRG